MKRTLQKKKITMDECSLHYITGSLVTLLVCKNLKMSHWFKHFCLSDKCCEIKKDNISL